MQGLGEGANITLAIDDRALSVDFDRLRQLANNGIGFICDTHSWSPDLIERVMRKPGSCVRKSNIFPAQHDRDIGSKVLLGTVDISDVHDPDSNEDLSSSPLQAAQSEQMSQRCVRAGLTSPQRQ